MFDTLLESNSRRERSAGGTIASVGAHTALITAAILATAHARVQSRSTPELMHTVYFPPRPVAGSAKQSDASTERSVIAPIALIDTRRIGISTPTIEISAAPSNPIDFPSHPGGVGGSGQGETASSGGVFDANQVEKQVALVAGSAAPRYPEVLRSSGVEGQVMAQFVVDESGRAEVDSVRFLRSDNRLFEDAVRSALPRLRFTPAEIGGRKVRQLVQMPFVFTLSK
jgi:protein TonB